jgi:pimeloyl-ACP methyl ester carboxylesterase
MAKQWLNTKEYPFRSNYMNINGYKLHYIDEGVGDILLFVHGTPSWSFDFRNVIKEMKQHYRCIAVDHMGFGLSDKPEQYDYTTPNHSSTLAYFVSQKQLNNITLVVHDFGGPIGLNFAMQYPEKIRRLAIINSWLWSSEADPEFQKLKRVLKSPLLPVLYRYFNFSPRFILPRSFGD